MADSSRHHGHRGPVRSYTTPSQPTQPPVKPVKPQYVKDGRQSQSRNNGRGSDATGQNSGTLSAQSPRQQGAHAPHPKSRTANQPVESSPPDAKGRSVTRDTRASTMSSDPALKRGDTMDSAGFQELVGDTPTARKYRHLVNKTKARSSASGNGGSQGRSSGFGGFFKKIFSRSSSGRR